jgi:hypothetical protein
MGLVTVGIVAGIVGSIATILGLFKASSKTKDSHNVKIKQTHKGVGDNIGGNKVIHKTPYTGVQTVCMLPPHLGGNDSIELDGVGRLHVISWTSSSVTLALVDTPSISADGIINKDVTLGPDNSGFKAKFFKSKNFMTSTPKMFTARDGETITLSLHSPIATVSISDRVFDLRLLGIKKVQKPTIEKVSDELMSAYEIGINESI